VKLHTFLSSVIDEFHMSALRSVRFITPVNLWMDGPCNFPDVKRRKLLVTEVKDSFLCIISTIANTQ
jgi:hypothetical protein